MPGFDVIIERARSKPARIALPEGQDPRIIAAAIAAKDQGLALPVLIGSREQVDKAATANNLDASSIDTLDLSSFSHTQDLATRLFERRKHKGMTPDQAMDALQDPLTFACMLVKESHAEGCVAGAVYPTADVVRTALQLIGKGDNSNFVSSFFCMLMNQDFHPVKDIMVFADCALMIDPDSEELAEIAIQTGTSAKALLGIDPRIALLSFSTDASADHPAVAKVREATAKAKTLKPDWEIIGDVQLDAAVIPDILQKKAPHMMGSDTSNILVFPTLDAGNIGYKMCERFGGCEAIGPVLQGLAKPVNDLSRGCKTEDIIKILAITSTQASV